MADNTPLSKQDLLEAISGLASHRDLIDIRMRMATSSEVKRDINEMRGVVATKEDLKGLATKEDLQEGLAEVKADITKELSEVVERIVNVIDNAVDDLADQTVKRKEFENLEERVSRLAATN